MSYVIKFKDGTYLSSGNDGTRLLSEADRWEDKSACVWAVGNRLTANDARCRQVRIVRIKAKPGLDEAAIRRAERLRIANAVKSNEYVTTLFGYGISGQVREKDIGSNIITALSRSDAEWEPGE